MDAAISSGLSLVSGGPLSDEPDIGALTIAAFAREVTTRFADHEAVVLRQGETRIAWSYAELWARSVEVAKALVASGLGKDGRVGVLMTNRPEYISCLFGVALAGGVTVSLSTFSTPVELDHLLKAGAVSVLLFDRQVLTKDFATVLAELEPAIVQAPPGALVSQRFPFLRRLVALESVTGSPTPPTTGPAIERWEDFLAGGRHVPDALVEARASTVTPADVGAIFFSSGTTSLPKGIIHAQRAFPVQWWRWRRIMDIDPVRYPVRCWTGNGFFWSGNISQMIGYSLATGGAMVLQPVFQAEEALDLIRDERVSFAIGRPHQWARLEAAANWASADLSSLHYITYGEKLCEHPTVDTDFVMRPAFGTTETLTIHTAVCANTEEGSSHGSFGRPLPGNTLKIFDPLTGVVVPRGDRGEIAVKGATLMRGYVGKTAEEAFDAEGYFCTGDGGYIDTEGYLFWEGRLTDMIKTGGANVSPLEVDAALTNYPGVKRVQTVGVPDDLLGEMVVACILPHAEAKLDAGEIIAELKKTLASYKVPRAVLFLREEEFAVTGSEKVKTSVLRDLALAHLRAAAGSPSAP